MKYPSSDINKWFLPNRNKVHTNFYDWMAMKMHEKTTATNQQNKKQIANSNKLKRVESLRT